MRRRWICWSGIIRPYIGVNATDAKELEFLMKGRQLAWPEKKK
jgi:hypothetical protein